MKLTKLQLRIAKNLLKNKDNDISFKKLLLNRALKKWLLIITTSSLSALCLWILEFYLVSFLMIGFCIGGVINDIGFFLNGHKLTTLMKEITNWDKLEEIIEKNN